MFDILEILPETFHVKGFIAVIKFTVKHYLKFLKETVDIDLGFDLQEFYKDELKVIEYIQVKIDHVHHTRPGDLDHHILPIQYSFIYLGNRGTGYWLCVKLIKNIYKIGIYPGFFRYRTESKT